MSPGTITMRRHNPGTRPHRGSHGLPMKILLTFVLATSLGVPVTPVAHGDGTTYATGLAENRLIPFVDATQLRMDALTDLLIKEGTDRRTVYLTEGQIQAS